MAIASTKTIPTAQEVESLTSRLFACGYTAQWSGTRFNINKTGEPVSGLSTYAWAMAFAADCEKMTTRNDPPNFRQGAKPDAEKPTCPHPTPKPRHSPLLGDQGAIERMTFAALPVTPKGWFDTMATTCGANDALSLQPVSTDGFPVCERRLSVSSPVSVDGVTDGITIGNIEEREPSRFILHLQYLFVVACRFFGLLFGICVLGLLPSVIDEIVKFGERLAR